MAAGPWDDYAAKPAAPAQGPWSEFAQQQPIQGPAADQAYSRGRLGTLMDAFGQGAKSAWGAVTNFSPETSKAAKDAGLPEPTAPKAFNEALTRPALGALDADTAFADITSGPAWAAATYVPHAIAAEASGAWDAMKKDFQDSNKQPDPGAGFWSQQKAEFDRFVAGGKTVGDAFRLALSPISGATDALITTPVAKVLTAITPDAGQTPEQHEADARAAVNDMLLAIRPGKVNFALADDLGVLKGDPTPTTPMARPEGMRAVNETLANDPNLQATAASNLRIKVGDIDDSVQMPRTTGETIPLQEGPRFDQADTRGQGQQFHGSPRAIDGLQEGAYSSLNYYGQGFYSTDALDIAKGYANRRGATEPSVYAVHENQPVKLYDMEAPITDDMRKLLETNHNDTFDELVGQALDEKPKNLREVYDNVRDAARSDGIPADEVQEGVFDVLAHQLTQQGYGGLTHTGGLRTGKTPHKVNIYFEPQKDVSIASTNTGDFAQPVPDQYSQGIPQNHPGPQLAAAGDKPTSPTQAFPPDTAGWFDKAGNIRTENLTDKSSIAEAINQTADRNADFVTARRGALSPREISDLSDALGMTPESLNARKIGQAFNAEQILGARKLLVQTTNEMQEAAQKAAASGSETDLLAYSQAEARQAAVQSHVAGITAEWGRGGNAFKSLVQEVDEATATGNRVKDMTGENPSDILARAKAVREMNDPNSVARFNLDARKNGFGDKFLFYWTNGLLSGPFTHTAYAMANSVFAFQQAALVTPVASAIGLARRAILGGDIERVMPGETAARLWGLTQGTPEAIRAGWRAFKAGVPDRLPGAPAETANPVNTRSAMPLGESFLPESAAKALGIGVGLPSRAIGSIHSIFASLGYRTEINAQAYRMASKEGLAGDDFSNRVAELTANPTEDMMEAGRDNADSATFTSELDGFGKKVQALANHNVATKMVAPFVRTPGNIFKAAYEQTPFAVLDDEMRADLTGANGAVARDTAAAKIVVGSSIAGMTMYWASQGVITGGGPTDRNERAAWLLTNRPYSVRVGDTMVDYRKMGALGVLMGASADLHDVFTKGVSNDDYGQAGTMMVKAAANAVVDNTFTKGAADLIEAIQDPDRYGKKYIYGMGASFLPYSTAMGQAASVMDPDMRSARDFISVLKNKTPGERETLFPVRDMWGQPVPNDRAGMGSILAMRHVTDDPVNLEMSRLGIAPAPLERQIRGVKLNDEMYDEYERTAGPYAKTTLDQMVNQPGWSQMPDFARKEYMNAIIENSRKSASSLMLMRHPEIIEQATDKRLKALEQPVAPRPQ